MAATHILLPVFVQVTLTMFLVVWLGRLRAAALRSKEVRGRDVSLNQPNWPEKPTQVSNCFNNQFQIPVLFYAIIAFILILGLADWTFVGLAWVFAISRLVHAYFYTSSNNVPHRFRAYTLGYLMLAAMWIWFAAKVLGGL